jgi:hypothetical protein
MIENEERLHHILLPGTMQSRHVGIDTGAPVYPNCFDFYIFFSYWEDTGILTPKLLLP